MSVLWFFLGILVGAGLVIVLVLLRRKPEGELARELAEYTHRKHEQKGTADLQRVIDQIKESFKALAGDVLRESNVTLLDLAASTLGAKTTEVEQILEGKRKLINGKIESLTSRLGELDTVLQKYRDERNRAYGRLEKQLANTLNATTELGRSTSQLTEALASTKKRGDWGERMAADVLTLAGFLEGVNYQKHERTEAGTFPDYTFLLPQDLKVHMDVKFPLDNYLAFFNAEDERSQEEYKKNFLRDVKARIKEVTTRDYIDPSSGTIDCVIVFIPNEQIFGFIQQSDPSIMDEAIKKKVVLCSPLTLYAVLAIIRQAVDNFRLGQTTDEILALLGQFATEWEKYKVELNRIGNQMRTVLKSFETLEGPRTRQLERPLGKIEDIRQDKGISVTSDDSLPEGDAGDIRSGDGELDDLAGNAEV